jgi:hypothetical protein
MRTLTKISLLFFLLAMQVNSAIAQNASIEKLKHARIWTSTNGKKMRASFVKIDGYDIVRKRL